MDKKKRHSSPDLLHQPVLEGRPEEVGVGGEANDQHDGVSEDGEDLSVPKLHILRKTEICLHQTFA